jgi:hypothetical protein
MQASDEGDRRGPCVFGGAPSALKLMLKTLLSHYLWAVVVC